VISFVPTSVDALPGAVLNPDAAEAVASDGAGAFGDVLEQLMGTPAAKGGGVDLPLDDEGELSDEAELDELANANVVTDLGAQPIIRLALAPAWALTDATATPVAVDAAVDSTVAERSVSAPTGKSQPVAEAGLPPSAAIPPSATPNGAPAFAALMPEAGTAAETLPAATSLPEGMNIPSPEAAAAPAAAPVASPVAPPVAAPAAASAVPDAAMVSPAVAAPPPSPAAAAPSPEMATRDISPKPEAERPSAGRTEKADKNDHGRPAFRVAAEAGHRAYVAAASESTTQDTTQHGMGDARGDARNAAEPAAANTPAATPFQVVAERPAPVVGPTLAAAAVVPAEAIETAAAIELPAQVVQSIRMQAINGGGEAVVRLNPEYLGELVVAVKVEQGAVSAALQSDVPAVRKWVEANEGSLRQALAEHGLQLERLTVSGDAPQTENGEREARREDPREQESQPESRRQRKKAPDATFEVIV
jgi:flagellar hook-length control protein FliK